MRCRPYLGESLPLKPLLAKALFAKNRRQISSHPSTCHEHVERSVSASFHAVNNKHHRKKKGSPRRDNNTGAVNTVVPTLDRVVVAPWVPCRNSRPCIYFLPLVVFLCHSSHDMPLFVFFPTSKVVLSFPVRLLLPIPEKCEWHMCQGTEALKLRSARPQQARSNASSRGQERSCG